MITAANLGQNENTIAIYAAILTTLGSYTFDKARTPVFSPYVVFAGPPNNDDNDVASPSPIKVL